MIPGLRNRHREGMRFASFWSDNLSPAANRVVQWLQEFSNDSTVYRQIQGLIGWFTGDTTEIAEKLTISIDPLEVRQIGADLQQRLLLKAKVNEQGYTILYRPDQYDLGVADHTQLLTEDGNFISTERGKYILVPVRGQPTNVVFRAQDLYPRYVVPIPPMDVKAITTGDRDLVPGLDFAAGDGCLIFNEPPEKLFPERKMLIRAARRRRPNLLSYTLHADQLFTNGRHIVQYLRQRQTILSFRLAVAEIAGAAIMPWDGVLQQIIPEGDTTLYVFDAGTLEVRYPHTPLVLGDFYPKNLIIDDVVKVLGGDGTWWRAIDWSNGLSLDKLCPFKGLSLPDQNCRAYAVAESVDVHARIEITGPVETQNLFWELVRQSEVQTGYYLNAVIGLADINDVKFVNPLDIYFQYLLQSRGIYLWVDAEKLGWAAAQRAHDFAAEEKPLGSILLT